MSVMTKTLLVISGGEKSVEIVRALRTMGHAVVVSDSDPQAPAFALADSCLIADVHGASETAAPPSAIAARSERSTGFFQPRTRP
jgi:formate-dependent phosphoribosylglycinamide formyltransferase (GAR transformylase)